MPTSSGRKLDAEIRQAFMRGWFLNYHGYDRPDGETALARVEQAGHDAYDGSDAADVALEKYLRGNDHDG